MADDEMPRVETLYVGTMMAFLALQATSISLASRLADVPDNLRDHVETNAPLPDYRQLIGQALSSAADATGADLMVTDLEVHQFDPDKAREIALDMVQRSIELIGMLAGPAR